MDHTLSAIQFGCRPPAKLPDLLSSALSVWFSELYPERPLPNTRATKYRGCQRKARSKKDSSMAANSGCSGGKSAATELREMGYASRWLLLVWFWNLEGYEARHSRSLVAFTYLQICSHTEVTQSPALVT